MSGTPDEKPQRATAAQLANRKIKEIRRRPRGTTPTGGSEPAGTFSQLSSAPAFPAPSFAAPTNQSGGFNFGQSQSFPGASATPSEPTQGNAAPFSFGGNSSTPFNFAGGFGNIPPRNPFATDNPFTASNTPPQPAPTAMFGGFGSQSTAQPTAQPTSQPTSQPAFSFGAPQNAASSAGTGLFGRPAATSANGNSVADSMQTSPDSKPKNPFASASSLPNKNIFGDSGAPNIFASKPAAPAGNPFGGLSFPAAPAAEKPPSEKPDGLAPKSTFASQAPAATSQVKPFGSLFGGAGATPTPSEPEKAATNDVFGPKADAAAPTTNLFTFTSAAQEPEKANATPSATNNIFATKPAAEQSASGGLFAPKPAGQTSTPNLFTPKVATNDAASTTATSQPFQNLFGATATAPSIVSESATEQTSSSSMFAPKPATEQTSAKPAEIKPFGGLFGAAPTTLKPTEPAATPSLFAPKPAAEQASDKPPESPQPFKNLFGGPSTTPKPAEPATAPNLFVPKPATEQPAPSPVKPFANMLGGKTATPQPTPVKAPTATPSGLASVQKPAVSSELPKPTPPPGTSKEVAEQAELLWKIRGLDTHFKQQVMKYEPGIDSFDHLILFYIKVRNGLGAPVKGAPKLEMKKAIEEPVHADGPNGSATSNLFAKSFSSPSSSPAKPVAALTPAQSATGNLFAKSMSNGTTTPSAPVASPAPKLAGNMFAQPASPAPAASPAPKLAGNMFAQAASKTAQNGSPAPAVAPPKFVNGVGAVDFMAQFKQKAEKTMAEEKAKRKAEDFDSESDDEEEWERRDAEKQREKRAKLEAATKKKSVFRNGKFEWVDADEPDSAEAVVDSPKPAEMPAPSSLFVPSDNISLNVSSPASSTGSIFESSSLPLPASENIFGRLTPQPNDADKDSDGSGDEGKATSSKRPAEDEASTDDDFASALRNSKRTKPSETTETAKSSLDTPLPAPTAAAGRSLFDRIQSPAPTPQKETSNSTSSLFSASFGQSTSFGQSISFGQNNATPAADKTWKLDTPIKFSTDSKLTATSAPASTLASTQPSSGVNSGEATPDEETAPGEIFDMSRANAGEEEETLVYECRAQAFKLATGWTSQGKGIARLLKHPETGRARIVVRTDPGGNIVLNTLLKKDFDYSRQSNSVQFLVPQADQEKPEQWAVRVRADAIEEFYSKVQEIKN
ncbi:uncharacterized protein N7473_002003 [Penicillium subrubescens]|uniref:uncharacterized protein n=1 Tax=Penicillium subrubescens TaxID=1316194 RepID=UPI00254592EF|nr:uncharacterized protein N7473_002003 [Penicillium subrubescens]KAJ5905087.1 hypothetical protein N7473_002003 [Penicillium subrubescens]